MQRDVPQINHGEPLEAIGEIPLEPKCSDVRDRQVCHLVADFGVPPRSPALDIGSLQQC
jgi:hypothetical protein